MASPAPSLFSVRSQRSTGLLEYLSAFGSPPSRAKRGLSHLAKGWNTWGGGDVYCLVRLNGIAAGAHKKFDASGCSIEDVDIPVLLKLWDVRQELPEKDTVTRKPAVAATIAVLRKQHRHEHFLRLVQARMEHDGVAGSVTRGRVVLLFRTKGQEKQTFTHARNLLKALDTFTCNPRLVRARILWRAFRARLWRTLFALLMLLIAGTGVRLAMEPRVRQTALALWHRVFDEPSTPVLVPGPTTGPDRPPAPGPAAGLGSAPAAVPRTRVEEFSRLTREFEGARADTDLAMLRSSMFAAFTQHSTKDETALEDRLDQLISLEKTECGAGELSPCRIRLGWVRKYLESGTPLIRLRERIESHGVTDIPSRKMEDQLRAITNSREVIELLVPPEATLGAAWTPPTDGQPMLWRPTNDGGFWIDQTEVTRAAYYRFIRDDRQRLEAAARVRTIKESLRDWLESALKTPTEGSKPVAYVDWDAASAYCKWAGKTLPSDDEWGRAVDLPSLNGMSDGVAEWTSSFRTERPALCGGSVAPTLTCVPFPRIEATDQIGFRCAFRAVEE